MSTGFSASEFGAFEDSCCQNSWKLAWMKKGMVSRWQVMKTNCRTKIISAEPKQFLPDPSSLWLKRVLINICIFVDDIKVSLDLCGKLLHPRWLWMQATVEGQIYPQVERGFSDSNAYLRELTLKSMLVLAPKLSQKTIQQSLLKHLSKLQVFLSVLPSEKQFSPLALLFYSISPLCFICELVIKLTCLLCISAFLCLIML